MSALGAIINERCEERGWSLRELARRADLPSATVHKIATNASIMPTRENVCALAAALGIADRTLLMAAAVDGGYITEETDTEGLQPLIDSLRAIGPARRNEVAALVEAMLRAS
jgi:transcriptional regulator with XRE-family HTH domain